MRIQKDLFGTEIKHEEDDSAIELSLIEGNTFEQKVKRFKYLEKLLAPDTCEYGNCSGLGVSANLESRLLFEEAKTTYVNGEFIATILLCQAFIEHWLTVLCERNVAELPKNLEGLLTVCCKEGLVHPYVLEKINDLRLIRNPLTHRKSSEYPYSISQRMVDMKVDREELLENDAKKAIEIMFTLLDD
jgi:hypothetical protein